MGEKSKDIGFGPYFAEAGVFWYDVGL